MSRINAKTNFKDNNGVDLGDKLITKDYLISVYPSIGSQIGIPPELWTWGYGSFGCLGNNSTVSAYTPITTFSGGANWKQVTSGSSGSVAIKTDGTLWTWGYGTDGRLGNNAATNVSTPVTTFSGGTNWKQVSFSGTHTVAIKTDGTLWAWGLNPFGDLGINNTRHTSTPVTTFAGGTNWKQVSCKGNTTAIKTDGTLWLWGRGFYGQLGTNDTTNKSTPVTTFSGGTNWKQVSSANDHVAAVKTDGTLWAWGRNNFGQLGTNDTNNRTTPVTTFSGGTNWKQVSCGLRHTSAIKTDGTLWTWGYGSYGQLGNNDTNSQTTPITTFSGGTNWKQVSCGYYHTSAIKTDGTLWTWGLNNYGQIGTNDTNYRSTPVTTFTGGTNWKQVDCGSYNTSAIQSIDFI